MIFKKKLSAILKKFTKSCCGNFNKTIDFLNTKSKLDPSKFSTHTCKVQSIERYIIIIYNTEKYETYKQTYLCIPKIPAYESTYGIHFFEMMKFLVRHFLKFQVVSGSFYNLEMPRKKNL